MRLPAGWYVDEQAPVTTEDSEPEPDLVVVRGTTEDYRDRHPSAAEVALVVEVADSSLRRDRDLKKGIYARAGFAVYWLLDLNARKLEVYSEPSGTDYGTKVVFGEEEMVSFWLKGESCGPIQVGALLPLRQG